MIVHKSYDRFDAELELMTDRRPDLVITALGSPARVLDAVHGYGGAVFADVMSVEAILSYVGGLETASPTGG